jgi:hypothetical protein
MILTGSIGALRPSGVSLISVAGSSPSLRMAPGPPSTPTSSQSRALPMADYFDPNLDFFCLIF